jgi:hypothetical protein
MNCNQKMSIKARCLAAIAALAFCLPRCAHSEDYVISLRSQTSSPQEISLPLHVKFALRLQDNDLTDTDRPESRRKSPAAGDQAKDDGLLPLNLARLDQRHDRAD